MAADSSSSHGSGAAAPRGYSVDVRVFLLVITAAMAVSFGAGVAFGPTTATELAAVRALSAASASRQQGQPAATTAATSGGRGKTLGAPDAGQRKLKQPRREATAHSVELGARINRDKKSGLHVNYETPSYEDLGDGKVVQRAGSHDSEGGLIEDGVEEDDEHLPQGQHLLVDIKNIEAEFLNSESRLAEAMISVVRSAGLTLLSYHCHSLDPGVSCVGVLLESHISFHTWPDEGVITLDLFTCGSKPLVPTLPLIEGRFAVPIEPEYAGEVVEPPVVLWSHKLRGFRGPVGPHGEKDPLASDLGVFMLGQIELDLKREVRTVRTDERNGVWIDFPSWRIYLVYLYSPVLSTPLPITYICYAF